MNSKKIYNFCVLFVICSLLSYELHSFSLKKLHLKEIIIENDVSQPTIVTIELEKKCDLCDDQVISTTDITVKPHEKNKIASNHNSFITNFNITDQSIDFFIKRSITQQNHQANIPVLQHTINISEKNENQSTQDTKLKFVELDFDTTMLVVTSNKNYFSYREAKVPAHLTYMLPENIEIPNMLAYFKQLHDKNRLSKISPSTIPKIPYIIHQIWFGITGNIPHLYRKWQKRLKQLHPEWRILCWNKEMLETHFYNQFYNQDIFDEAQKRNAYATMADISRYEIINKFGGFYTDFDSEPFESLAPLHTRYDFFTSLEPVGKYPLGCALNAFGAKPEHPVLQACLALCKQRKNIPDDISKKLEKLTHIYPIHSRNVLKTFYNTGPYLFIAGILAGINQADNTDIIFPNNYCCHWFSPTLESFCKHNPRLNANSKHWKTTAKKEQ